MMLNHILSGKSPSSIHEIISPENIGNMSGFNGAKFDSNRIPEGSWTTPIRGNATMEIPMSGFEISSAFCEGWFLRERFRQRHLINDTRMQVLVC